MKLGDEKLFRQLCYIGGAWVPARSAATIAVDDPATGEVIGRVPNAGREETRAAIEAASAAFPEWRGSLFVGSLAQTRLVRLTLDGTRVSGEEHLLADRGQRVRDVRQAPDGTLFVVTDEDNGELWKLTPKR